jgi:hypothetical protein
MNTNVFGDLVVWNVILFNITHVFNYGCSLFTILCNTGSLQLYDLLFVP